MKFFIDLTKKQLVKSAASNVALERLVLKRRDSLAVEVVFVQRNAVATMPVGTTTSVALKRTFADSNFLALASGEPPTLNLNTVPLEAIFSAGNPAAVSALLEIRWTVPGETTRTATLQAEVQNSVILGTEATPEAIPDGKATQAQAEAGTDNTKWMTPLRTAQAIAELAPPPTWNSVTDKPATFPPITHQHAIAEVAGLLEALDGKQSVSAGEATQSRVEAVETALDGKSDSAALTGRAYIPQPHSHEITATNTDGMIAANFRAQSWTLTFKAARAFDFHFPATITVMGQILSGPKIGDFCTIEILESGVFSGDWTARFKRPDGSLVHTVTRSDSELEKSSLRFVYDGSAWELDRTVYHQHTYRDLLDTPPDVETGYFDRATDAASRPPAQGQASHQVVLSNDSRLKDARSVDWLTPPPNSPIIPTGVGAPEPPAPGTMSYDGSHLYIVVPMPGGQSLRWARSPMSATW